MRQTTAHRHVGKIHRKRTHLGTSGRRDRSPAPGRGPARSRDVIGWGDVGTSQNGPRPGVKHQVGPECQASTATGQTRPGRCGEHFLSLVE